MTTLGSQGRLFKLRHLLNNSDQINALVSQLISRVALLSSPPYLPVVEESTANISYQFCPLSWSTHRRLVFTGFDVASLPE